MLPPYAYNARNECVEQIDPDGNHTFFAYDLAGNMLSQTDPDGNQTVWTYDNLNRVSTETECAGTSSQATASYVYDLDGNVVQSTDYDGHVIDYSYDDRGRETGETWMSGNNVLDSISLRCRRKHAHPHADFQRAVEPVPDGLLLGLPRPAHRDHLQKQRRDGDGDRAVHLRRVEPAG